VVKDIGYIKNLNIIQKAFENKTNKEIKQLLVSIANEEAKIVRSKSS
jgi:hypothetical protein